MGNKPLISVLVANYNNGRYITQCLDSILAQTYSNLEIVIVDDMSDDDSIDIINSYQTLHPTADITLYINESHTCVGYNKNKCIELSLGEYYLFLDPDDTLSPEAITTLYKGFQEDDSLSIVYATHYLCDEQLNPVRISDWPGCIPSGQSHITSREGHISAPALCRRSMYAKTKGVDITLLLAEDQDMYLKLEEIAPVKYVNKPLYYYRKHANNISWNEKKALLNAEYSLKVNISAYKRRKGTMIPNLKWIDIQRQKLMYHLKCFTVYKTTQEYAAAFKSYMKAMQYFYADCKFKLLKTLIKC